MFYGHRQRGWESGSIPDRAPIRVDSPAHAKYDEPRIGESMSNDVAEVIEQVRRWPRERRLELVRWLNELTAMERLEAIAQKVGQRAAEHPLPDEEIDQAVAEARKERPLHRRSST
jgi:hypothetical protein